MSEPRARTPTHIPFPYRPSRRGNHALRAAAQLAQERGAPLTVLAPVVFATAEGDAFHHAVKKFAREHGCDLTVMTPSVLVSLAGRRRRRGSDARDLPIEALRR